MKKTKYLMKYFLKPSILVLLLTIIPNLANHAQELNFKKIWATNSKSFLESAPTVADINDDGKDEVIIAGREEIIAFQGKGKELWRWDTRKRFITYPAILKRKGKGAYIYAADNSGLFTCLDGNGKVVWQAELNDAAEWSASALSDIDNDGIPEVVQTDIKGTVWIFNALSGKVMNKISIEGKPASPALGDLDGDGNQEIIVSTNLGFVYAIKNTGKIIWKKEIGGFSETWATSSPVIYAASDNKRYVIAASSSGELFCLDLNGQTTWKHHTRGPVASTISVGDFDQNGIADIFLITQLGVIYRFDEKGNALWDIDMQGRSLAPGAIIDINNDGKLEYIFSTQQGNLLALSNSGEFIFNYQFGNRTINVTPAFGDIYGNANTLEMALTGGESGLTFCYGTAASKSAIKHWTAYRGDSQNTGSWFGLTQSDNLRMIPQNLAWNTLFTGENILFNIYNPAPGKETIKATASCTRPDGSIQKSMSRIIGKKGALQLPVNFDIPGIYIFSWKLSAEKGNILLSGNQEVNIQPFRNDRTIIEHAIQVLNATAMEIEKTLALSAKALQNQAFELKSKAAILSVQQDRLTGNNTEESGNVQEETAQLVKAAKRALRISNIVSEASMLGSGTSLIAFEGSKWENRNVDKQLPSIVSNPVLIKHDVVPGEHQPVPLVLLNITGHMLNVRLETGEIDAQITITPLHSVSTVTSVGETSWDALPEINESGIISIPALSAREIWLDVNIGDVKPGVKKAEITFYALNGAGVIDAPGNPHAVPAPETKIKLSLDVLPFNMAPAGDFRLCTWSPSTGPEVKDLLAHGNNVFIIPQGKTIYTGDKLTDVDFTEIGEIIDQFKGIDVFLLSYGLPEIKSEFASDGFKSDYNFYLDKMLQYLNNKEIDTDHFALYAIDEPGGHGWDAVNTIVSFGKIVHGTHPEVMIYMDGGGELPMFNAMAEVIDVWVPPYDWLPEQIPEMEVMRSVGKNLWSYNCTYSTSRPVGPNIKNINIAYEFRTAALMAFHQGSKGIGYWCYSAGKENPWMRIKSEYNLIYPGRTKPVTSRRWEAVREGIEDYRILSALQEYLNKTGTEQPDDEVKKKIEHLISVSLPELLDGGFQAMKVGLSRDVIDMEINEDKTNDFREEMMECVKLITK